MIWIVRIIVAFILLQTLYFKFTAQPESVYIFSTLGLEPYGRIGSGFLELIAGVLILIPEWSGIGAALSLGVISGAVISHLTTLGIVVKDDGGQLFCYALVVMLGSIVMVYYERKNIPILNKIVK